MKVLYVLHQFFPHHYTGTERLTLQIAKQMQRMGNFVTVLTCEPNEIANDGFKPLEKYILKKEYQVESIPVIAFRDLENDAHFDIFPPIIEKYLRSIIKKFDVVHFTHPMRLGSVLKVCKELGIPTVLTLTDNWLLCPQGLITKNFQLCDGPDEGKKCMSVCRYDKKILSRFNEAKFFIEHIDVVFSGCEFVRQTFKENGVKRKTELNTFSVDYSFVKHQEEGQEIVFGFIGTLAWHKGLHVLIDAFSRVKNENIKLKIYGSGDELSEYVQYLFKLAQFDNRIEFCGTFDYKDLSRVMKDISVIVIPSVYKEIYPLVMQMGLAYKKPIIATKIGGLPEVIINEVNGYLFELEDAEKLAELISMVSDNPQLITKLKQNIINPPRIEEEAFVYENTYKKLIELNLT
jgi:glycosyltransferase involved in cell wall biosynthesis